MATGLPDNIITMLAATDAKYNLKPGTMHALMQQETGGNSKYLQDPTAYHYGLNAEGRRIAGHTGKVSTAFGPFGILESTAADPGFGVKPLKDKTSLAEQMDFAGAYASKRGLAAYGEGEPYARQVEARIGKGAPVAAPVQVAQTTQAAPVQLAQMEVPVAAQRAAVQAVDPSTLVDPSMAWNGLQQAMPVAPVQVADLDFGKQFPGVTPQRNLDPNFQAFGKWKARV